MNLRTIFGATLLALPLSASGDLCVVFTGEALPSDAETGDFFADAIDVDSGLAVIGADGKQSAGMFSGAAYVYGRSGTDWIEQATLSPTSTLEPFDRFGGSVSISGDRIAIGASGDDDAATDAGAVYIFELNLGAWTQTDKLMASDATTAALFGKSVSIDGDSLLVGAIRDDESGADAGAAYVFTSIGGVWIEEAKLLASDGGSFSAFGNKVKLEGDRAIVAAPEDDIDSSGAINDEVGAVYVYDRVGTVWAEQAKLQASNAMKLDRFGGSIGLSKDLIAVGAPGQDSATISAGAVYVYEFLGNAWQEVAQLTASDAAFSDLLGISLDLQGTLLVAGAVFDDDGGTSSGSAYVFENQGAGWFESGKLTAPDALPWDRFGCEVALDGRTAMIGSVAGDGPLVVDAGTLNTFALGHLADTYGAGLAGSGGFIPELSTPTCPADFAPLTVRIENAIGGGFGVFLAGFTPLSAPLFGGLLLVSPPFFAQDPHVLTGAPGVAGAGTLDLNFPPQSTNGAGQIVYCQVGYLDAAAVNGVSLSAGLAVELP